MNTYRRGIAQIALAASLLVLPESANGDSRVAAHIANSTGRSRADAVLIERSIVEFMDDLESQLRDIAESDGPTSRKDRVASKVIQQYFASDDATVWVSSAVTYRSTPYEASTYLSRLARLRERYATVRLYFEPGYLGMGRIQRVSYEPNTYEVSLSVNQIFIGATPEYVYADETKKQFRVRFRFEGRTVRVLIHEITVSETRRRPEMTLE